MVTIRLLTLLVLLSASTADALAQQKFPSKPLRIVVAATPGSAPDLLARLIGAKLQANWEQPVVIDNRPGASGILDAHITAKSAPDGYTLLVASPAFAIRAALIPDLPYDSLRDFAAVTDIGYGNALLVTGAGWGVKSVKDLIALANANPGKFFYASPGAGTANYLNAERFRSAIGISARHVGYKGEVESLIEVAAGRAHFTSTSIAALPMIQEGKLVALAQRFQHLPGVPLIADVVPSLTRIGTQIMLAPAGTPLAIRRQISREVARIVTTSPDIKSRFHDMAFRAMATTPEECERSLRADIATLTQLVKELGLRTK